jgi:hypothetical protein
MKMRIMAAMVRVLVLYIPEAASAQRSIAESNSDNADNYVRTGALMKQQGGSTRDEMLQLCGRFGTD